METTSSPAGTAPAGEQQAAVVILNELLAECREGNNNTRRASWAAIQDPEVMTILANGWRQDEAELSTMFATLQSVPGCAARSRNLRSAVKNLAEDFQRRDTNNMVDQMERELNVSQNLLDAFGNGAPPPSVIESSLLERLRVPRGYTIDSTGVYRLRAGADGEVERIKQSSAPLFIGGRTVDILTGEARRQVIWRGPSGWCSRVVDRRTLMDASRLIALSDFEAPVSSANLSMMVKYLDEFEAENGHRLPSMMSTRRMGWQPDGSFLLPEAHFVPPGERTQQLILTAPTGFETLSKGWTTGGTWQQWLEAVNLVIPFPFMFVSLYASAAAPLLEILRLPGFVVDFSGETSGGKTTALRFSASVWGRPSESFPTAMYSWDATKVWIERVSGFLHNLPVILDETKRAKSTKTVRDVIYDFCQGQGRGRGSMDGTRYMDSWRSILISSGEGAATSFSQDAGTRARVLSLRGKPLGNNPERGGEVSEEVQMILADNYGHLGRKIAEYLVANASQHEVIRNVFREARAKYAGAVQTAVARRHAANLAVLEVAASIIHTLGVPRPEHDPFAHLIECQEIAGMEADRPLAALQDILSWAASNQIRFHGRHETDGRGGVRTPSSGWAGRWDKGDVWKTLAITTMTAKSLLYDMGHHPDEIINRWADRGWLEVTSKSRSRVLRVNGASARCYCITRAAADEVCAD